LALFSLARRTPGINGRDASAGKEALTHRGDVVRDARFLGSARAILSTMAVLQAWAFAHRHERGTPPAARLLVNRSSSRAGVTASGVKEQARHLDRAGLTPLLLATRRVRRTAGSAPLIAESRQTATACKITDAHR
jgi:hypothetical protein